MAQNRKPPAYQEYPASILANRAFRQLSLASRGLVWSMRLECWENHSVPSSSYQLARTLGYQQEELKEALTADIYAFFEELDGVFICPELENYRSHLEEQRVAKSEGGKKGAAITNSNKTSKSKDSCRDASESLVKSKPEKQNPVTKGGHDIPYNPPDNQWVNDYEDEEGKEGKDEM